MERIARAFLIATGLIYTALLFYAYAYFADLSFVRLKLAGEYYQITNDTFFYTGLIIPMISTIICVILANLLKNQPVGSISYFKSEKARTTLYSWSISLGGAFHLFYASLLTIIIFVNNEEGLQQSGYIPLLFLSLAIIAFWIIWLPLILRKNK